MSTCVGGNYELGVCPLPGKRWKESIYPPNTYGFTINQPAVPPSSRAPRQVLTSPTARVNFFPPSVILNQNTRHAKVVHIRPRVLDLPLCSKWQFAWNQQLNKTHYARPAEPSCLEVSQMSPRMRESAVEKIWN